MLSCRAASALWPQQAHHHRHRQRARIASSSSTLSSSCIAININLAPKIGFLIAKHTHSLTHTPPTHSRPPRTYSYIAKYSFIAEEKLFFTLSDKRQRQRRRRRLRPASPRVEAFAWKIITRRTPGSIYSTYIYTGSKYIQDVVYICAILKL